MYYPIIFVELQKKNSIFDTCKFRILVTKVLKTTKNMFQWEFIKNRLIISCYVFMENDFF